MKYIKKYSKGFFIALALWQVVDWTIYTSLAIAGSSGANAHTAGGIAFGGLLFGLVGVGIQMIDFSEW